MKINYKRAISPLVVLLVWEGVAHTGWIDQYFLPPLTTVVGTLYTMIRTGEIFPHIAISIYRGFSGYLYAAIAGIFIGLCIASSRLMEHISDPLIELLRPISTFALVPLMFLWFGVGESSKIILIAKACFFPIVLNTIAGIKGVDAKLVQAARSLGAEGFRLWTNVLIPSAMPMIVTGLRISTAIALLSIVGMEMIAADSGIGFLIVDAQRVFATDRMFAGIIVIAVLGFYVDRMARYLQHRFMGWHVETSLAAGKI
jgi:ABC-type nitrate/sulfonate/bicarbonate transport system permease component